MEAITPESFEFINGWEPDDVTVLDYTTTASIGNTSAITRKLLRDCGWAERTTVADGNTVKAKYFGIITLGAISKPVDDGGVTQNATIYCSQLDPGISTSFDTSAIVNSGTNSYLNFSSGVMPDLYTGNRVVYQQPTSESQGIGS